MRVPGRVMPGAPGYTRREKVDFKVISYKLSKNGKIKNTLGFFETENLIY